MTTIITLDPEGNNNKLEIPEKLLKYFSIFKDIECDIKLHGESIIIKNINQEDFLIICKLLTLEDHKIIIKNLQIYDTLKLFNLYKIVDFFYIEYLQNILGSVIANRLNKMNVEDLKIIIQKLF